MAHKGHALGVPTPFCDKICAVVNGLGVGFTPDPAHIQPLVDMLPDHARPSAPLELPAAGTGASTGVTGPAGYRHPPRPLGAAPLRVAGVGAGYFAQFHYEAWSRMQAEDHVTLLGICDTDQAKADQAASAYGAAAAFNDFGSMLEQLELDILDIVTPPATHLALVQAAARCGVPCIICQKPLAPSAGESACRHAPVSPRVLVSTSCLQLRQRR